MTPRQKPKTLEFPEPAASLWIRTRTALASHMPAKGGWRFAIGGGTVLAARWRHRRSTDIDIMVRRGFALNNFGKKLAAELTGELKVNNTSKVLIVMNDGKLDITRSDVEPPTPGEPTEVSGAVVDLLSTTQILRGKLQRALELSPVRDAYDIITAARKPDGAEPLTAAHNLLPVEVQHEVEDHLARSDERFAEEAPIQLQPTEDSRADWNAIGTTAASELHGFRLAHVRITLHDGRVLIARTTNNGHRFETAGNVSSTVTLCQRANLSTLFDTIGLSARKLKNEIDVYHSRRRSGTIVDTTDDDPLDRLRRLNRPSPRPALQRPRPAPNGRTDSPVRTR